MRRSLIALATLAAVAAGVGTRAARGTRALALPASVVDITRPTSTYSTVDYTRHRTGKTTWRVVQGTGNCCEN